MPGSLEEDGAGARLLAGGRCNKLHLEVGRSNKLLLKGGRRAKALLEEGRRSKLLLRSRTEQQAAPWCKPALAKEAGVSRREPALPWPKEAGVSRRKPASSGQNRRSRRKPA